MRKLTLGQAGARLLADTGIAQNQALGARVFEYEPGEAICQQGQPLTHLLLVMEGRAKVCLFTENGRSLLLSFYDAGGMIGDMELMMGEESAHTSVEAVSAFRCVAVPLGENRAALMGDAGVLRTIGAALARKLDRSSKNGAFNILYPLESRLCSYIDSVSHEGFFDEKLTEVAELLGASYRHLLRALKGLCAVGVLCKDGRGYRIGDQAGLKLRGQGFYAPIER